MISCWVAEHISNEFGQSIVQLDCLAAQWSEPVLLQAWLKNLLWCPLAPDVTSYLQEPDTHEHSQLKSIIREVKGELHFQLEQECKNKSKEQKDYVPRWGAYEVLSIAGESLKRFKVKYPRVPLQGLIQTNMLVMRPSATGLEITPDTEPYEPKLPPSRGIPPQAAIDRLESCRVWLAKGRAPKPDWDLLNAGIHLHDPDLEENDGNEENGEEPLELDFRMESLELTEHQLLMLQPPEVRIKAIVYPEGIRKRAAFQGGKKRKSKWGGKFAKHFTGRTARQWRQKVDKHGQQQLEDKLAPCGKVSGKKLPKIKFMQAKSKDKTKAVVPSTSTIEQAKQGQKESDLAARAARKRCLRGTQGVQRELVPEHKWLKKHVRVVAEV